MTLLAEMPLSVGDKIKIIDSRGKILKAGKLVANPSGSIFPFHNLGEGRYSFYFDDGVYVMENQEYIVEVEGLSKGFRVRPISSFMVVADCIKHLSALKGGPAYEAFRQSIVKDLLQKGYSDARAKQVIDEMMISFAKK